MTKPLLLPDDPHNQELIRQTHPSGWVNPTPQGRYNLVVIGSGTAGLTAAGGCAALGGRAALIERHLTGGDCLVTGCVPSKAIIRSARAAATLRSAQKHGIRVPDGVKIDGAAVMERMRRLRAKISPHDSVQRLKEMGVDVYFGEARFISPTIVEAADKRLEFSRAVIATGGRPVAPPIPGLKEAGFLTNENLFELTEIPKHFAMIGAGPIGCEMAQTFQRLGSQVTLIDVADHVLIREDPDAAEIIQRALQREGVQLVLGAKVTRVVRRGNETVVAVEQRSGSTEIACDALLVGVGRAPNIEGLNLEVAGVKADKQGIAVNDFLQTSNSRIYAAGDVASPYKFTHVANAQGRLAMINTLFWPIQRTSRLVIPWCTYTDPEIAHVGLYEAQAKEQGHEIQTLMLSLEENDRAVVDGEDEGFIRVHLKRGTDRILGATVVAAHAGDLLTTLTQAMTQGKGLSSLAQAIYPYPTQSEIIRQIAGQYQQTKLSSRIKNMTSRWLAWRRI
ncbi:MAG: mercuric reductase [Candidatus Omnitrophica bacterium]|nr:mercuric reductase [Candidatus Omnitrophota bacterium]